jgi:CHAT domain-containing protein
MIHLATHGFFLGEGCPSAADGLRGTTTGEVVPAVAGESPLLLSGFALAGANHRDAAGPDEEDGILTAEEIASLNLTNVDWAVLSACDTGVGEVRVGEGVFGLRRAFQVAGARTLIMSLWPVEDEASRQWMKALYSNRFAKGMSTIDAVHEANLEVLRHRREAGLSTHPAFWAGFIASGDWQ